MRIDSHSPRGIYVCWEAEMEGSFCKSLREIVQLAQAGAAEDHEMLVYYRHQLNLFSQMCLDRQYKGIERLAPQMPLRVVLE